MGSRPIKLLLLVSLLCWATGAAHFAHEQVESAESSSVASSVAIEHDGIALGRPAHVEADCATCQLLATMRAEAPAAAAILFLYHGLAGTLEPRSEVAPALAWRSTLHSRGPPAC